MPAFPVRALAGVVAAMLLAGCGGSTPPTTTAATDATSPSAAGAAATTSPAPGGPDLLTDLCAAADDAGRAPEQARGVFFQRVHEPLHELARAVTDDGERAVAGRLLQAKEQVEAAFNAESVPDDLPDRFQRLVSATRDALEADGRAAPPC